MASASTAGAGGGRGRVEARAPVHMSFVVNGASGAATPCAAAPRRFKKVVRRANAAAGFAPDSSVSVTRAVARRGLRRALNFGRCNEALLMAQLKLVLSAAVMGAKLAKAQLVPRRTVAGVS